MRAIVAIGCALVATQATADAKARVSDKLAAVLTPLRSLAVAERETKICASSQAILDTASAVPDKAPAGVPLDKLSWEASAGGVANLADSINDLCKTRTHSQKSVDGTTITVASQIALLYVALDTFVDAAKPRTLPAPLATVRKSVDGLSWKSAQFCAQAKAVVAGLAKVERPATSDKAMWDAQFALVKTTAQGTQDTACAKGKAVPEEVAALQPDLASKFYRLVLLVPAS